MSKIDNILVYQWNAWDGYLISHLVADYCRIDAAYDDDASLFDSRISPHIKAVLMQMDLTRSEHFPARRDAITTQLRIRGLRVLNQQPTDISKNQLHRLLHGAGLASARARQQGPEDEWLFVKSNLNWGGGPEQRLPPDLPQAHRIEMLDSLQSRHIQRWSQYHKLRRAEVPTDYWSDPNTVIERYIENAEHCFYRVYGFGETLIVVKAYNRALIKKIANSTQDTNFHIHVSELQSQQLPIPHGLARTISRFIETLAPDYFCLDVLYNDQGFVIVDLNLTPYAGHDSQHAEALEFLRIGADTMLGA